METVKVNETLLLNPEQQAAIAEDKTLKYVVDQVEGWFNNYTVRVFAMDGQTTPASVEVNLVPRYVIGGTIRLRWELWISFAATQIGQYAVLIWPVNGTVKAWLVEVTE